MRKIAAIILAILLAAPAMADSFLDDFNYYASEIYDLNPLDPLVENVAYKSAEVEIMVADGIEIYSEDALSVISAACCVLRVIDNTGSQIDQYGKVLHAYFLHKSGNESRATTDSGILIFFSEANDIYTIRLVK